MGKGRHAHEREDHQHLLPGMRTSTSWRRVERKQQRERDIKSLCIACCRSLRFEIQLGILERKPQHRTSVAMQLNNALRFLYIGGSAGIFNKPKSANFIAKPTVSSALHHAVYKFANIGLAIRSFQLHF